MEVGLLISIDNEISGHKFHVYVWFTTDETVSGKIAMCDILCRKKNKQTKHVNQCVHTVSVCGQIGEMY